MGPGIIIMLALGAAGLALGRSKKTPPGEAAAPVLPPFGVPPSAPPVAPGGGTGPRRTRSAPASVSRFLAAATDVATGIRLAPPARKEPPSTGEKWAAVSSAMAKVMIAAAPRTADTADAARIRELQKALAPQVGAATLDIINMLGEFIDFARPQANGNGGMGDALSRGSGRITALVAICLFPPIFDVWNADMQGWRYQTGIEEEHAFWPGSTGEVPVLGRGPDGNILLEPANCAWEKDPEAFALQIGIIRKRLHASLDSVLPSTRDAAAPDLSQPFDPNELPHSVSDELNQGIKDAKTAVSTVMAVAVAAATTTAAVLAATGAAAAAAGIVAAASSAVPVIGWVVAAVAIVVDIILWLVGLGGAGYGAQSPPPPQMTKEEDAAWKAQDCTVLFLLGQLLDDCKQLMGVRPPKPFSLFIAAARAVAPKR